MKNLTMANIENIALKVSADIFATTVAYPNHWIKELEAISNIELSQTLHHNIILESLFFGIYYVNSRLKNTFSTENQNEFEEELINRLIWSLSNLYFASETKDTTAITEDTKELFSIFLPPKLKEYATFKKGNI